MYKIQFFFFQAEDGIRDRTVTGVQTCALPISALLKGVLMVVTPVPAVLRKVPELAINVGVPLSNSALPSANRSKVAVGALLKLTPALRETCPPEIGRASCRERV